jgi:hypothetical protein
VEASCRSRPRSRLASARDRPEARSREEGTWGRRPWATGLSADQWTSTTKPPTGAYSIDVDFVGVPDAVPVHCAIYVRRCVHRSASRDQRRHVVRGTTLNVFVVGFDRSRRHRPRAVLSLSVRLEERGGSWRWFSVWPVLSAIRPRCTRAVDMTSELKNPQKQWLSVPQTSSLSTRTWYLTAMLRRGDTPLVFAVRSGTERRPVSQLGGL